MEYEAEARGAIDRNVWSGLYDPEEIVLLVGESVWGDEYDENWLRAEVEKELVKKRAAEATWPKKTDCDRLEKVFKTLQKQHIIVLEDAGMTKSDGLEEVEDEYEDAGSEKSGIEGYCFYHGQDLEHVLKSGELWLAFGDIQGDAKRSVEIGRRIKSALEAAKFTVEWKGTVKARLLIKGIKWQRRTPDA
jgi:hypothetical protein